MNMYFRMFHKTFFLKWNCHRMSQNVKQPFIDQSLMPWVNPINLSGFCRNKFGEGNTNFWTVIEVLPYITLNSICNFQITSLTPFPGYHSTIGWLFSKPSPKLL